MNYPNSNCDSKCQFVSMGGSITTMYSPIVYDKDGKPVGGGSNIVTSMIRCQTCSRVWISRQTELEKAQGKPIEWEEI